MVAITLWVNPDGGVIVVLVVTVTINNNRSLLPVVVTDGAVIVAVLSLYFPLWASIGELLFTPA